MTRLLDTGFDGVADGVAYTSANSSGLDTFNPAGGVVASATAPYAGDACARIVTASSTAQAGFTLPSDLTTLYTRMIFRVPAIPASNVSILQMRNASNNGICCEVQLRSTGTIRVRDTNYTAIAGTESDPIAVDAWVMLELGAVNGTPTLIYYPDPGGPGVSKTAGSYSDPTVSRVSLGVMTAVTTELLVDSVAVDDAAFPGAPAGPLPSGSPAFVWGQAW